MGAGITRSLKQHAPAFPDPMTNHVPHKCTQYCIKILTKLTSVSTMSSQQPFSVRIHQQQHAYDAGINQFTHKGLISLSKANLLNLKELLMNNNAIGGLGCKYITRAKMPNLKRLCLDTCSLGSTGMLHLSKGNWKSLIEISLVKDNISRNGSAWLTKTKWRAEIQIFLVSNEMNVLEFLLFLFCPDECLKCVDLRYRREAPQDLSKLRAWIKLRKMNSKSKILI